MHRKNAKVACRLKLVQVHVKRRKNVCFQLLRPIFLCQCRSIGRKTAADSFALHPSCSSSFPNFSSSSPLAAVLLEQSDEGNLHAALSILDSSIKCAATFHDQRKTCQRQTSVFQRSSIFYGLQTPLIDVDAAPSLSARQIALRRCGQQDPLPFDELYSER